MTETNRNPSPVRRSSTRSHSLALALFSHLERGEVSIAELNPPIIPMVRCESPIPKYHAHLTCKSAPPLPPHSYTLTSAPPPTSRQPCRRSCPVEQLGPLPERDQAVFPLCSPSQTFRS